MKEDARGTVVLDSCILITFSNAEALPILLGLGRHRLTTSRRVTTEITKPPASAAVAKQIESGKLTTTPLDPLNAEDQEALRRFDAMPAFRNRADAEVLALAETRGFIVGSDDIAVRRLVAALFGSGRIAGSLDFLKWAVEEKRATLDEAICVFEQLDIAVHIGPVLERAGKTIRDILAN